MSLDDHPTLLRTPSRYGQWFLNERILPGSASDYIAEAAHPGWVLVVTTDDEIVYFGPGAASVARSPAPF